MHSMRLFGGSLSMLALSYLSLAAQVSSGSSNEAAIRSVVADYMLARNAGDAEAVRRLLTPDADQLVSTGEWRKGVADLIRGTSASSRKEAGKSSITVEDVRFVDDDVAIVDGRYQTVSKAGTVRNMWTTIVVRRAGPEWRITAIRNMLPAAAQ